MDSSEEDRRRRSTRLQGWDYASPGAYFVTICSKGKHPFFGSIRDSGMHLSPAGEQAHRIWQELPDHHPHVEVDEFVIMPNHMHGILIFQDSVATFHETSLQPERDAVSEKMSAISPKAGSLSVMIRLYKGAVTRWARANGYPDFAWQPRFYDHIIRDDEDLHRIRRYISLNPLKWSLDPYHAKD